jgi:ABC-type polysaccharide/polyol phosphate transport system ATPase subunit
MTPAIELSHVTKIYRRYSSKRFATLKSALLSGSVARDLKAEKTFPALQDVSFSVAPGRTYGVVGRNGSGKSTALKVIAGITKPTSGTVRVNGRISALIELGAGFHPEISGRENVFINGIMLGLTKREIADKFDEIVEFAELKDFIDAPVKTYSSGMYMRLGFAVAIHVDPDVLLVDEVLAVGDEGFTHKCLDKFGEFKRRGKTILLVTHSLALVERLCDEAIWLDKGKVCAEGDPVRVVGTYVSDVGRQESEQLAAVDKKAGVHTAAQAEPQTPPPDVHGDMTRVAEGRWGSREVEICSVTLSNAEGQPSQTFQSGDVLRIGMAVRAARPVTDLVFGVGVFNAEGACVYGTNTDIEHYEPAELSGEASVLVEFGPLDLIEGTYKIDLAVHKRDGAPYDYHRLLHTFRIQSSVKDVGIYRPKHRWEFSPAIRIAKGRQGQ